MSEIRYFGRKSQGYGGIETYFAAIATKESTEVTPSDLETIPKATVGQTSPIGVGKAGMAGVVDVYIAEERL